MDDPRTEAGRLQDETRWLLVVLVGACVLAAGVLAVSDVPGLVGRRWQVVGAVSAGVTVLALVLGLLAVLRAMAPEAVDDEVGAADDGVTLGATDHDDPEAAAPVADAAPEELVLPPRSAATESRRAHRQALRHYHRARTTVTVAVVVALLGMVGMATASVVDGNNVEARTRRQLEAQLQAREDGPITEPESVEVQLTTPGLRRVAEAMGCTGAAIGASPVQGWAVSGTYRNPTVVLFGPVPACQDISIALAPRDGFVYPTILAPVPSTTVPPVTSTTAAVAPAPAPVTPTTAVG